MTEEEMDRLVNPPVIGAVDDPSDIPPMDVDGYMGWLRGRYPHGMALEDIADESTSVLLAEIRKLREGVRDIRRHLLAADVARRCFDQHEILEQSIDAADFIARHLLGDEVTAPTEPGTDPVT